MFTTCENLKSLPDISKWKTYNIKDIYNLFYSCSSLKNLPDISKWNINYKVTNLNGIFN